jgi:integrase
MGIHRRKGSPHYWADFTVNGSRFRISLQTSNRQEAELIYAQKRSEELLRGTIGRKPQMTLDDALGRYLLERGVEVASKSQMIFYGRTLLRILGKATTLDAIDDDLIARFVSKRRGDIRWANKSAKNRPKGETREKRMSGASINREMHFLRAVLNRARKVWKVDVAEIDWGLHRLQESAGVERFLSPDEARALLNAAAPHLRPVIVASLNTGLRMRNVLDLDWSEVDMDRRMLTVRIGKKRVPGGAPHSIPINGPLLAALGTLGPKDAGPVFTFEGKPVKNMRTAFRAACRRAGVENFRWHDMRHTAASWMIDQGVALDLVQKILGHSDIRLTLRYAHRNQDAQRKAVEAISGAWQPDTMTAHSQTKAKAKA